jgi:acyl carrier protein
MTEFALVSGDGFCQVLADYFFLESAEVRLNSRLKEDLAFDSIQVFELFIMLEEVADCEVPEDLMASLATVEDAYSAYMTYAERS